LEILCIQDLGLNIILARRALEQMHQVTHLVSLSTFFNDLKKDHVTYAQATIENHLEILLVAGILSPNITKINPPTVMNQPKIK
jgi:hypothetical protein